MLQVLLRILTMYLLHSKVKARSQKATIILKSQAGHATHVSWSSLANVILLFQLGREKLFSAGYEYSEGQVEARSEKVKLKIS